MSIGTRIKAARALARLSQRELAEQVGVSAMQISKYERDLDLPGSDGVLRLADALGVTFGYLFRRTDVTLTLLPGRQPPPLSAEDSAYVLAQAQDWVERYLETEHLLDAAVPLDLPSPLPVATLDEVEQAAQEVRTAWQLGTTPIRNLAEVLDAHGLKVGLVDAPVSVLVWTLLANGEQPVIVLNRHASGEQQRFALALALGALVLAPAAGLDAAQAAQRFARALLVPEPLARAELGSRRYWLDHDEVQLLIATYGLPLAGWVDRALELDILDPTTTYRVRAGGGIGFRNVPAIPVAVLPPECSTRQQRLVMRGVAEDAFSESRAAELLAVPQLPDRAPSRA